MGDLSQAHSSQSGLDGALGQNAGVGRHRGQDTLFTWAKGRA
jgi:hypothetical protein